MDLKQQWFYRFLKKTLVLHILAFWTLIYLWGGLPYLTWTVVNSQFTFYYYFVYIKWKSDYT